MMTRGTVPSTSSHPATRWVVRCRPQQPPSSFAPPQRSTGTHRSSCGPPPLQQLKPQPSPMASNPAPDGVPAVLQLRIVQGQLEDALEQIKVGSSVKWGGQCLGHLP